MNDNRKVMEKKGAKSERGSREETLLRAPMHAYRLGFNYDKKYGGCGQTPLAAIMDALGLQNDGIYKAATAFSGGIGNLGIGPCGAFTAGVMAISYKFGRERYNWYGYGSIDVANVLVKRLYDRFIDEYGSIVCEDIQKKVLGRSYNLLDPEEKKEFNKARAQGYIGPEVVGKAARWTVQLILEGENEVKKTKRTERFRRKGWEFIQFSKDLLLLR